MDTLLELIKIILPSSLVFLAAWVTMRAYMKKETEALSASVLREQENKRMEVMKANNKTLLPIRLQAYERMTLFCARIELGQLISRTTATGEMSANAYRFALKSVIDEEFNHNITQQIYMSDELWNIILLSKKETTKIIDAIFQGLPANAPAKEFLENLVAYLQDTPQSGYATALAAIKKEVSIMYG
jgi:CRISPR/Cas system CMR subunit Cmr4 (Cas7 group RAMP superfamily)